jgi:biopolymer transport protein ExbD
MTTWKVRQEGSPQVRQALSLHQVLQDLEEGEWGPTDEVRGPDDADWKRFEDHPLFADAVAFEPLPQPEQDETHIDMTPLIDVTMVLLVFFILLFTYSVLEKRLEAPNARGGQVGPRVITPEEVKKQMIMVSARRENGKTVFRIEDKEVPRERLEAEMASFVRQTPEHTTLLLDASPDVPHGDTVFVEDKAKGAGIKGVMLLVPPEEKKP